jgi:hypothetical protein
MIALQGTIKNGQVVLPQPVDLPDETAVTVLSPSSGAPLGRADEAWPTDAECLARLMARMERVEPFDTTPQEEADMEAWWQKVKEYTIANQGKAIEGLFK